MKDHDIESPGWMNPALLSFGEIIGGIAPVAGIALLFLFMQFV